MFHLFASFLRLFIWLWQLRLQIFWLIPRDAQKSLDSSFCLKEEELKCKKTNAMQLPSRIFYKFHRNSFRYHYSFVRLDMRKKMSSVSNKSNYANVQQFLEVFLKLEQIYCCCSSIPSPFPFLLFFPWQKFENYNLEEHGAISPHPVISHLFSEIRVTNNYFDIDLKRLCSSCFFVKGRCICKKK